MRDSKDSCKTPLPFIITDVRSRKGSPVIPKRICDDAYVDITVQDTDETTSDAMEEFATSTTMHGVILCYRNRNSKSKWFWIGLMIG